MRKFYIKSDHEIFVDDYENGEGDYVNSFDLKAHITADTPMQAVRNYIQNIAGYDLPDDQKVEVDEENPERAWWSVLVDKDNMEASPNQVERWKRGELRLYVDRMTIYVQEKVSVDLTK